MENGVDTQVGSFGLRLSGGQKSRVALARTLCHAKNILILDDPFSAVDKPTEKLILENLKKYYGDRLIIIISHRLTSFPTFDKVLWIENGKVVNHTNTVRILDENREEVEVTQEFDDIVHLAAQIDHDVMVLKILKTEAHTFVYTELNVNLRTPCTLYYYNPETRSLAQLHEWDDEKVTLIKVVNPELLKDLRPKYCLNPSAIQQFKPMFLKIISFLIP